MELASPLMNLVILVAAGNPLVTVVMCLPLRGQCLQNRAAPCVTCGKARLHILAVLVGMRGTLLAAKSVTMLVGNRDSAARARKLLQSRFTAIYPWLLNLARCRRLKLCMTELVRNPPRQLVRVWVFVMVLLLRAVVTWITARALMCEEWLALCRLGRTIWKRSTVLLTYLLEAGSPRCGLVLLGLFRRKTSRGRLLRMRLGVAIM